MDGVGDHALSIQMFFTSYFNFKHQIHLPQVWTQKPFVWCVKPPDIKIQFFRGTLCWRLT